MYSKMEDIFGNLKKRENMQFSHFFKLIESNLSDIV